MYFNNEASCICAFLFNYIVLPKIKKHKKVSLEDSKQARAHQTAFYRFSRMPAKVTQPFHYGVVLELLLYASIQASVRARRVTHLLLASVRPFSNTAATSSSELLMPTPLVTAVHRFCSAAVRSFNRVTSAAKPV